MASYLGTQVLGGVKPFEKRRFIVVTDRYLVVARMPRVPNVYLYALLGGIQRILRPGEIRYGPEDMAKTMEALDKHKVHAIPLEQIRMIDIVKGKRGLLRARKGSFTIWLADGRQIELVGEYDLPYDEAAELFSQLFPGRVRVFTQ